MRTQIEQANRKNAMQAIADKLEYRIQQKGEHSFASTHEILGVIAEEYAELIDAVKSNRQDKVEEELLDIAVACALAIACIDVQALDW